MSLFQWNDSYSVNISSIDEQHKTLFWLINKLHNARMEGKGSDVIGEILKELIKYTQSHFALEEQFMKKHNYPEYEQHKAIHDDLVKKVLDVKAKFEKGDNNLSGEVFSFLRDWLVNHIQGTDKKYAPYLKKQGVA